MHTRRNQIGLTATIGVLSLIAFTVIVYLSKQAAFQGWDLALTQRIHGQEQFLVSQAISGLSDMGGSILVFLILQIAVLLGIRRHWSALALWLGTLSSGYLLNLLLKQLLQGPRPHLEDVTILEQSTGFPSGHTMMALMAYGLLAYGVWPLLRQPRQRWILAATLALLILLIGYSRMYIGVHYFSDVVGGYAAGLFWLSVCLMLNAVVRAVPGMRGISTARELDSPLS